MRVVLLGGAPGIGKTVTARRVLRIAARGTILVQWVDVDALWLHQPWRVDERTKTMVRANLAGVMANAHQGGIDILLVTWVFQHSDMHALVRGLAPEEATIETVQLLASEPIWRRRFEEDHERPPIDAFFESRYVGAQATPTDHRIETDRRDPEEVAAVLATILRLSTTRAKGSGRA